MADFLFGNYENILDTLNILSNTYGKTIANLRDLRGLTQEELKAMLSFSLRTLQRIEAEKCKPLPEINKILEICIVLKLPYEASVKLLGQCGLMSCLFRADAQSIVYNRILMLEGKKNTEEINAYLIKEGFDPLFKKIAA